MLSKLLVATSTRTILGGHHRFVIGAVPKLWCSTQCPPKPPACPTTGGSVTTAVSNIVSCCPADRDLSDWSRPERPPDPKLRMGFMADSWFQYLYPKLGVVGPYSFFFGFIIFLCSKEIYVSDHVDMNHMKSILCVTWGLVTFGGPMFHAWADKQLQDETDQWNDGHADNLKKLRENLALVRFMQLSNQGQMTLLKAKRENIAMQLDTVYRQRMFAVYKAVKARLDYQVELYNIDRVFRQRNLVQYVTREVMKAITPDRIKSYTNKCIDDLALLASRA